MRFPAVSLPSLFTAMVVYLAGKDKTAFVMLVRRI
jgi:hypothetical protein